MLSGSRSIFTTLARRSAYDLAIKRPERVAALIIQNGDIYEDQLGPKYAPLQAYFRNPTPEAKDKLLEAVSEEGLQGRVP